MIHLLNNNKAASILRRSLLIPEKLFKNDLPITNVIHADLVKLSIPNIFYFNFHGQCHTEIISCDQRLGKSDPLNVVKTIQKLFFFRIHV